MKFDRNIKYVFQWQVTMQFNPSIIPHLEYIYEYGSCQTQLHIHIDYPLINDDSNDEILETLSNLHSTLIKDFLSHLKMIIHRITSPFTKSD